MMERTFKYILLTVVWIIFYKKTYSQDPAFSQFFSSPLNINPSLTANINSDWRVISNIRDQWIGPASPYITGTISYDTKVLQRKIPNVEEGNTFGIGGMLMFDHAMSGIVKGTYASLNLSYRMKLSDDITKHQIAIGFGTNYGRKYIDFNRLYFEEQYTGVGFNSNLPTGEIALSNMKSYFSLNAGITYSISTELSNLDVGIAGFHLNKPKQTFLEDINQYVPSRKVVHANFEKFINDRVILNTNAIYQFQKKANYFSVGGALGYILDADNTIINGGIWYWSKNAVIPYIGIAYKSMQYGFSYDVTTSKLNQAARRPNTIEFSIIFRGLKEPSNVIPCPWK